MPRSLCEHSTLVHTRSNRPICAWTKLSKSRFMRPTGGVGAQHQVHDRFCINENCKPRDSPIYPIGCWPPNIGAVLFRHASCRGAIASDASTLFRHHLCHRPSPMRTATQLQLRAPILPARPRSIPCLPNHVMHRAKQNSVAQFQPRSITPTRTLIHNNMIRAITHAPLQCSHGASETHQQTSHSIRAPARNVSPAPALRL